MFLWCIVTDLSLVSSSPYDDDLSLYVILKALSWIRFILLLSPLLWNIHIRGQYPNCDSINDFMTAIRASALRFRLGFLHKWLIWSSNFNSWPIFIHRRTSALLKSIGKPSTIAVVASAQLIVRWLLSLFAYEVVIKTKGSDEPWCCWYLSFFGFLVYSLSPWRYRDVFPVYSVPRYSKKTNLEDTSQSQEINAVVALVSYHAWKCVSQAIFGGMNLRR